MTRRGRFGSLVPALPLLGALALAAVLFAGSLTSPTATYADDCGVGTAIQTGFNGTTSNTCTSGAPDGIFTNQAKAEHVSSPFSFAAAWADADTSNATLNRPTYAWAFNRNTILGLALAGNDADATNVNNGGNVFGINGSAFAIAENNDSAVVATGAFNNFDVSNINTNNAPFQYNVFATATTTDCLFCLTGAVNNVEVNGVSRNFGSGNPSDGVSDGTIFSQAINDNALGAFAASYNNVNIRDSEAQGWVISGDNDDVGVFASATNIGDGLPCFFCWAAAYNSLDIERVQSDDSDLVKTSRAAATNDSPGGIAFAINDVELANVRAENIVVAGEMFGYAFNTGSFGSIAGGINDVNIGSPYASDYTVRSDNSSAFDGGIQAWGENQLCNNCLAFAQNYNEIGTYADDEIRANSAIVNGNVYAWAKNLGPLPPGFEENVAVAFNDIIMHDHVRSNDGNIVSGSVYSEAINTTGVGGPGLGYCYECLAYTDNKLVIDHAVSGLSMIDTSVYSYAENYNAYEVLAASSNKLIIKDVFAPDGSIVAQGEMNGGQGVYAWSWNRYCDVCLATADNKVVIKDVFTGADVLSGNAYAWAENYLDDTLIFGTTEGDEWEGGNYNTAVAYNTLIIKDYDDSAGVTALVVPSDVVAANVYACASNNVGGYACHDRERIICDEGVSTEQICETGGPGVQEVIYDGTCIACHAFADNHVVIKNDSSVDIGANSDNELSTGGIYAHAENTAQGITMIGACIDCNAVATNNVLANNGSVVNGPTSSTALNENSVSSAALSINDLHLNGAAGHAESSASNIHSTDSAALSLNVANGGTASDVESYVETRNENADGSMAVGFGVTNASDGGTASNDVRAATGGTSQPATTGIAIGVGFANGNNGNTAQVSSDADASNDGTSDGFALSLSVDANGNVALAVVFAADGTAAAVTVGSAVDGAANAEATADGSATQGGTLISVQDGTPTASTDNTPAP